MTSTFRINLLRFFLVIFGLFLIFALYPLMMIYWPAGFTWEPRQHEYEQMILGVYITLGVFLLIAAKNPLRHLSLIWFAAISSLVHGFIMLIQALTGPGEIANLYGDVPALILMGIILTILTPKHLVQKT